MVDFVSRAYIWPVLYEGQVCGRFYVKAVYLVRFV